MRWQVIGIACGVLTLVIFGCTRLEKAVPALPGPSSGGVNFGTNGYVSYAFSGTAQKILVSADDGFYLSGTENTGTSESYDILKYSTDGTLDTSFGVSGKAASGIPVGKNFAVQSSGKIIIAGATVTGAGSSSALSYEVRRLNADGSVDTTFNSNATSFSLTTLYAPNHYTMVTMVLQSDDKIVVGGMNTIGAAAPVFTVTRLTADGAADTTFNTTGIFNATPPTAGDGEKLINLLVQGDGQMVIGGTSCTDFLSDPTCPYILMRVKADGSALDATFGTAGAVTTSATGAGTLAEASDGTLLIGATLNGITAIIRYTALGAQDFGFGNNGEITSPSDRFALDASDNLIVASRGYQNSMVLNRIFSYGVLDSTYTNVGLTPTLTSLSSPVGVAVDFVGRFLILGTAADFNGTSTPSIIVQRYDP